MILLCGIPSEPPLGLVQAQLHELNVPSIVFNQRDFDNIDLQFNIKRDQVAGELRLGDKSFCLEEIAGVYTRLMDDRFLPELATEPADSARRNHCRWLHETLLRWCEVAPCRVVNRALPMGSNSSKPFQAQIIRQHGFEIPETLITNDPGLVLEFRSHCRRLVYKSISGVRSIVQILEDDDLERIDNIRWCPVQFQEYIDGTDMRVHVVGTSVFATAVISEAADYRYAHQQGNATAVLKAAEVSEDLAARCVGLTQAFGLAFSGIDLKIANDGRAYCFEVNPCPAFSYYEANTGQPIAMAVAKYLAGS